jgi:hypothetical protein
MKYSGRQARREGAVGKGASKLPIDMDKLNSLEYRAMLK